MTISRLRSASTGGVYPGNFTNSATGSAAGYKYVSFTASGTLTVDSPGFFDVLVIGGGGGGARDQAGVNRGRGGGAGGMLYQTNVFIPAGSYTVTVGAGGAAGASQTSSGARGQNSSIGSTLIALGGGRGVYFADYVSDFANGGCGGGRSGAGGVALIPSQGFDGGTYTGGGAGGAGQNNSTGVGPGLANSITGTSVTYARGGGAAGIQQGANPANSGNGGDGGGADGANPPQAGGSGIVIVRVNY